MRNIIFKLSVFMFLFSFCKKTFWKKIYFYYSNKVKDCQIKKFLKLVYFKRQLNFNNHFYVIFEIIKIQIFIEESPFLSTAARLSEIFYYL